MRISKKIWNLRHVIFFIWLIFFMISIVVDGLFDLIFQFFTAGMLTITLFLFICLIIKNNKKWKN